MRMVASLTERTNAPPEAPPEIDQDRRREVDYLVNPHIKRLEGQVQMLSAQIEQQQMQAALSQFGAEPVVKERAQTLMRQWRQAGLNGWTAEDAVTYAAGQLAREERNRNSQARAQQAQFNSLGQPLTSHSAPPMQRAQQTELPANFDSLPPDQQEAILEKRLGDQGF